MEASRNAMWEEYFALARERAFPEECAGLDPALVHRYKDNVDILWKNEQTAQELTRAKDKLHDEFTETWRECLRTFMFSVFLVPMVCYVLGAKYYSFALSVPYQLATGLCRSFIVASLVFPVFRMIFYAARMIIGVNSKGRETAAIAFQLLLYGFMFVMLRRGIPVLGSTLNWFPLFFAACLGEYLLILFVQKQAYKVQNRELLREVRRLSKDDHIVDETLELAKKLAAHTDERLRELNARYSEGLTFPAPMPWYDYLRTDQVRRAFRRLPVDLNGNQHEENIKLGGDRYPIMRHSDVLEKPISQSKLQSLIKDGTLDPYCGLGDPGGRKDRQYVGVYVHYVYDVMERVSVAITEKVVVDDVARQEAFDADNEWRDYHNFGESMDSLAMSNDMAVSHTATRIKQRRAAVRAGMKTTADRVVGHREEVVRIRTEEVTELGAVLVRDGERLVGLYYTQSEDSCEYVSEAAKSLGFGSVANRPMLYSLYNGLYEMSLCRKSMQLD